MTEENSGYCQKRQKKIICTVRKWKRNNVHCKKICNEITFTVRKTEIRHFAQLKNVKKLCSLLEKWKYGIVHNWKM